MSEQPPTAGQSCADCGQPRWHSKDCPRLRKKQGAAAWFVLPLVFLALALDRLAGESTASSVVGFLVAGAACGIVATVMWRRSGAHRDGDQPDV